MFLLGVHVINFIKGLLPDDWFDWFLAIWVIKVLIQSVTSKQVTLFCFKEKKNTSLNLINQNYLNALPFRT